MTIPKGDESLSGNECMVRQYKNLCEEYECDAKVYPKQKSSLKGIGSPDLMVLFTSTVSHKMIRNALSETKGQDVRIVRCHTSSMSALKNILEENVQDLRAAYAC